MSSTAKSIIIDNGKKNQLDVFVHVEWNKYPEIPMEERSADDYLWFAYENGYVEASYLDGHIKGVDNDGHIILEDDIKAWAEFDVEAPRFLN